MAGVTVRIRMEGWTRIEARFVGIEERFPDAPRRIVRETSRILDAALRIEAPKRTGRLAAEVREHVTSHPYYAKAWFTDRAPYAHFVLEGTRPHEIRPRVKQALFWEGALHPVRRVFHPGTLGNHFNVRAFHRALPVIRRLAREVMHEVIAG